MPVLTFRGEYLQPTLAGEKTHTTRPAERVPSRMAPGERLTMQFGRRDNPTTLDATITAIEVCRYLDWYEALTDDDPRQEMLPEALHAALLAGTPEEQALVRVAQSIDRAVEDVIGDLIVDQRRLIYVVHWRDPVRRA